MAKFAGVDDTPWTFCAPEGGVCAFTGTTEVRYGANGAFVYKILTDGTACTNAVFGDPDFRHTESCAISIPPASTDWTVCAPEGGVCAFTGTMEVRYGANGSYVYQTLTDGTACTNDGVRRSHLRHRESSAPSDPAGPTGVDVLRGGGRLCARSPAPTGPLWCERYVRGQNPIRGTPLHQ